MSEPANNDAKAGFEITVLNAAGERCSLRFSTEEELVAFMQQTWKTHAPVAIGYGDGSVVEHQTLDRIHQLLWGV